MENEELLALRSEIENLKEENKKIDEKLLEIKKHSDFVMKVAEQNASDMKDKIENYNFIIRIMAFSMIYLLFGGTAEIIRICTGSYLKGLVPLIISFVLCCHIIFWLIRELIRIIRSSNKQRKRRKNGPNKM